MITMTDWEYYQIKFEASEYRRLLTVCRDRVVHETERANNAEQVAEALLNSLHSLVEAFDPNLYRLAETQFGQATAADLAYQQARNLVEQVKGQTKQDATPLIFRSA